MINTTITNYQELLEYVQRDYITRLEAIELINTYLDTYFPDDISKDVLIASTQEFLETFGNDYGWELPLFPKICTN